MNIIFGFALIFTFIGIAVIFKLSPYYLEMEIKSLSTQKSLKKLVTKRKRKNRLLIAYESTVTAMKTLGQSKSIYTVTFITIVLVLIGAIGGLALDNRFLSPVFATCFACIPFIYVRLQYLSYKALLVDEMETALSVVTSSYERRENILLAFEENLPHINEPLKSVFNEFIISVNHTGVDIVTGLEAMKDKVNHPIFTNWIDELKRCQKDRNLKVSLQPVVNRISDVRMATSAAKVVLYEVRNEFWLVAFLTIVFMAVTYVFVPMYFGEIANASQIHFMFALHLFLLAAFSIRAVLLTKDIKFEI